MLKIVAFLLCFSFVFAETFSRTISVVGTYEEKIIPNEMNWQLSVKVKRKTLDAAAKGHNQSLADLLDLLKKNGVEKKHIQVTNFRFNEQWNYVKNTRVMEGYFASSQVNFKILDLKKYQTLWESLANIKGVHVQNTHYGIHDKKSYDTDFRLKAMGVAQDKAQAMANSLQMKLGHPTYIQELGTGHPIAPMPRTRAYKSMAMDEATSVDIEPGEMSLKKSVRIDFEMLPK